MLQYMEYTWSTPFNRGDSEPDRFPPLQANALRGLAPRENEAMGRSPARCIFIISKISYYLTTCPISLLLHQEQYKVLWARRPACKYLP